MQNEIKVRGFFIIALGHDDGTGKQIIDSKTDWIPNTVTNEGLNVYIAAAVGAVGGSKQFLSMQLGTQTNAINATQQSLSGETYARKSVSPSTIATGTYQATASWSSTDNGASANIGAIGLYNTSSGGTLGAGQTFASSQWNTNQNLSITYQLRFS